MSDFFDDIFKQPENPMRAAQQAMRAPQRKRFYATAAVDETPEGFAVVLDGKPVRTPARQLLAAPSRAIAQSLAQEWDIQTETIDPASMPLTRLANSIIDGVTSQTAAVADDVAKYLGSDLLFYRADGPDGLLQRQARYWDPLLEWSRETLGARFVLAEGIVHVAQPQAAIDTVRAVFPSDPWRLGAMHSITTLTGSALIALALAHGEIDAETAWQAAHVDEDWNMEKWGRDEVVLSRRATRRGELDAAVRVLSALR